MVLACMCDTPCASWVISLSYGFIISGGSYIIYTGRKRERSTEGERESEETEKERKRRESREQETEKLLSQEDTIKTLLLSTGIQR